jgi:MFS family permease
VVLLSEVGAQASYLVEVLPGVVLFGLGLATTVAPLTTTVLAAAPDRHAGLASGVNNAVARTAGLAGLAVIPVLAGLPGAVGADEITDAVHLALVIAAALAVGAGVVMSIGLAPQVRSTRTVRPVHCAVEGPPLQPDPHRCPFQDEPVAA